jgi:hypothetical protein
MTTCVWFSCVRDYPKLYQSLARVRLLDPEARCVVVIDGTDEAPEGVEFLRREFDRGVHLSTESSVRGVTRTLSQFAGDMVVKLDSDMLPARAFWLGGPTVFQRANGSYVGTYALPPRVLTAVQRCITNTPNPGPHEAIAICFRAVTLLHGFEIPFTHHRLPQGQTLPPEITCL